MELPDEILEPILDEAVSGNERFAQLRRFACVNRQWSHICQARLFRSVTVGDEGHCYLRLMYFSRNAKLGQHVRELKLHQVGTLVQASLSWMGGVFANARVVTISAGPQAKGINAPELPMFLSHIDCLETLTLWYTSSAGPVYLPDPFNSVPWRKVQLQTLDMPSPLSGNFLRSFMGDLVCGDTARSLARLVVDVQNQDAYAALVVCLPQFSALAQIRMIIYGFQEELGDLDGRDKTDAIVADSLLALPTIPALQTLDIIMSCNRPVGDVLCALFSTSTFPSLRKLTFEIEPRNIRPPGQVTPFQDSSDVPSRILPLHVSDSLNSCFLAFHNVNSIRQQEAFFALFGLQNRPGVLRVSHTGGHFRG